MTEFVTVFNDVTESCARRAMPEVLAGTGMSVDVSVDNDSGAVQYTVGSTVSASITNLTYTASPTNGIVVSSDGTDATIPLATGTNAGLLRPLSGDASDVLLGNGTFGAAPLPPLVTTSADGLVPQLSGNVNHVLLGNGTYGPAPAHVKFSVADEGSNLGTNGTVTKIDFIGAGVAASRTGNTVTVNIPGGGGGGGGMPTNLSYTATPTGGTVLSDTGNDADIPLADTTDAGLLPPLSGDVNEVLLGDGTFGPSPGQADIQFVDHGTNLGTAGTVNRFNVTGGLTFTRSGNSVTLNGPASVGGTDLTYTQSPNNGIVVSSTGTNAIIPLVNTINAGLVRPLTGDANDFLNGAGQFEPLPEATTAISGVVELATNAEINSGTGNGVVTAQQLRAELDKLSPCSATPATATEISEMNANKATLKVLVCKDDGTPSLMSLDGNALASMFGGSANNISISGLKGMISNPTGITLNQPPIYTSTNLVSAPATAYDGNLNTNAANSLVVHEPNSLQVGFFEFQANGTRPLTGMVLHPSSDLGFNADASTVPLFWGSFDGVNWTLLSAATLISGNFASDDAVTVRIPNGIPYTYYAVRIDIDNQTNVVTSQKYFGEIEVF